MGQKVRPVGFRTGIMIDPLSTWYAGKKDFSEFLLEDVKVRKYVKNKYRGAGISKILIARTREKVLLTIYAARVGVIIGKKGTEVEKLTKKLENLTNRAIEVKTIEVNRPELDPQLVAEAIGEDLAKRQGFRRAMKKHIESTMENGAKGIKVQLAGRLGGAEMARCEIAMQGSIPLSTLRAKVDYGFHEASTAQGNIGIKVWINNGDYLSPEGNSDGTDAQASKVSKKPARRGQGQRDSR
jgi:small subunit ribosomal protein S3